MVNFLYDSAIEALHFPPGVLLSGHFIQPYGFHQHRSNGRQDWLLTYTINGSGAFRVDDYILPCSAGQLVIIPPGIPQHYATAETSSSSWEFFWVHFLPRPQWIPWLEYPTIPSKLLMLTVDEAAVRGHIHLAFQRLIQENTANGPLKDPLVLNALEEILLLAAQENQKDLAHSRKDPRIETILHLLISHLNRPISVPWLAEQVSLSPSRLAHLFKEQVGEAINETLMKLRLQQGARFLEFTSRNISEIATEAGFNNPFYFAKQFKIHYAQTPTQYREESQKKWNTP
ncbi:helix-turn-helix domain-containing protein [Paenibacillus psychroresistens]|uniref:Helix-turn-helix domain-containing protein n=1 Tax=Paenibacillus psychroresistens TaxID=1778678 RepID=A0A6B8RB85_9BACL|nr:helix-turn-helix domain-containing protein [Paenibacillus psychroresistens]QGQ93739.1 helix-turn-helix domain-containing protein [Paenibacillus psychroresistens]